MASEILKRQEAQRSAKGNRFDVFNAVRSAIPALLANPAVYVLRRSLFSLECEHVSLYDVVFRNKRRTTGLAGSSWHRIDTFPSFF